ncbi:DUF5908 family protein [Lutimonas halocynthiae]|uniref:DUF5908 family protein n=1 Tax=Lutimonas halocynthiae TaxID=1446477 RepID=UPI0025B54556|nr:DUF5908 family protein [Lutimonas halocynthiae]MDN3643360.1 DUF5908 family protein [Lutimonas halocynthiae]
MPIEIRELLIKVKVQEPVNEGNNQKDTYQLRQFLLKECKNEIRKQLSALKER